MSIPRSAIRRLTGTGAGKQFTPDGVARVLCATLDNGYSAEEICEALLDKCAWNCAEDPDCNKKRKELVEIAQQAIQGNNQVLATADLILAGLSITFRGLLLVTRVVPALRPFSIPLQIASTQLVNFRGTMAARRAANDAIYEAVIRLAA